LQLRRMLIPFIAVTSTIPCFAQYRVLPGNVDTDGLPTSPARICLGTVGIEHCYTPPDYMKQAPFGLGPKAQTIGKLNGQNLTLFTSTFSGGGSGDLTNFALLAVKEGQFVNLLPKVQLTNQSEYKVWNLPQISSQPILITADFIWDLKAAEASNYQEETHFAHHRYVIEVFIFDSASGCYLQRVKYTTNTKYPGLDEVNAIHVITAEKPIIEARLRQNTSH
jgi:hypothetical protein